MACVHVLEMKNHVSSQEAHKHSVAFQLPTYFRGYMTSKSLNCFWCSPINRALLLVDTQRLSKQDHRAGRFGPYGWLTKNRLVAEFNYYAA